MPEVINEELPSTIKDKAAKIFFPNLDGWRFVAFLAVFYHHSFSTQFNYILENPIYKFVKGTTLNGELGVDFFFVLSGFLIIYLLIKEKDFTGKIHIQNFYIRRILRIFPLYYFCVFFGFVVFPFIKTLLGGNPEENAHLSYYLIFLGNIDIVRNGVLPDASSLGILWSVAIEEQFYLTIPFLLTVLPTKSYKWVFYSIILLCLGLRAWNVNDQTYLKYHTFSYIGDLAIGGLSAYYSIYSSRFLRMFENLNSYLILILYIAVISILLFRESFLINPFLIVISTPAIALLFAAVILEQNYSNNSLFKMMNNRIFSYLGKYTYGLYCLHTIAALITLQITSKLKFNTSIWEVFFTDTILMFILSITLAYLSYHLYEVRFLRLKSRFAFITRT